MDKIELINKLIEANPEDSNAWYLLGLEYAQNNNIIKAVDAFLEALKYCDDSIKNEIVTTLSNLSKSLYSNNKESVSNDNSQDPLNLQKYNDVEDNENCQNREKLSEDLELNKKEVSDKPVSFKVIEGKRKEYVPLDEAKDKSITFSDVGGLDDLKDILKMQVIKPFTSQKLYEKFKKKLGRATLLYGPPGCGKSLIAKAIAGECKANFIPVRITDVLEPYFGVRPEKIKERFSKAREKSPCVLFFDDMDMIGFNRAKVSSENTRHVINQFLVELEGIQSKNEKILVIGATSMPWDVDPALIRPGRFDRLIFVMPPDLDSRKEIFALKLKGRPIENIDYRLLAGRTQLYSGADIENVVEIAAENAINSIMKTGTERKIGMRDLLLAIDKTNPSTLDWFGIMETYLKYGSRSGMFKEVEVFLKKYKRYLGG
ncbi:MAG TPA: AAA family ATPase [Acetivibrio sp.]|uniref:AAA family ATPase n=1 Tax=Acetivibrio sp. TaxID=1872092 RepID=UPI002BF01C50|nr:AAA family ATPase [Acetivibrio sp.]HOM02913.1 AAA family ATPase [Acetivibrio sp.]